MKKTLATLLAIALFATTSFAGSWEFSKDIDDMTDEVNANAIGYSTDKEGILAVRCKGGSFDVLYLSSGQYFAEELSSILVRKDKSEPVRIGTYGMGSNITSIREDHNSLYAFLRILKEGSIMKIKSSGYSDNQPKVRTFNLSGSTAAIEKVQSYCK